MPPHPSIWPAPSPNHLHPSTFLLRLPCLDMGLRSLATLVCKAIWAGVTHRARGPFYVLTPRYPPWRQAGGHLRLDGGFKSHFDIQEILRHLGSDHPHECLLGGWTIRSWFLMHVWQCRGQIFHCWNTFKLVTNHKETKIYSSIPLASTK